MFKTSLNWLVFCLVAVHADPRVPVSPIGPFDETVGKWICSKKEEGDVLGLGLRLHEHQVLTVKNRKYRKCGTACRNGIEHAFTDVLS